MFTLLSRSTTLKRLASSYGMATPRSFARRFIAGEQVEDAIAAARALQAKGLLLTLDYLGESVETTAQATAATLTDESKVSTSQLERADRKIMQTPDTRHASS